MGPGDVAVSFDAGPTLTSAQHRRTAPPTVMRPVMAPRGGPGSVGGPLPPAGAMAPMGGPGGGGPGLGFMSFPLGEGGPVHNFAPPPRMPAGIASGGFGSTAFEDEPPLLEELGINIPQIARKMVSVLNPLKVDADLHEDGDLSGPVMFCMLFGLCQLLNGKVHFGIILGWASLASVFLYGIFNLLVGNPSQPQSGSLDLYRCCSITGYSLLPVVLFSALSLFVPRGGISLVLGILTVGWCTRTSSSLLVNIIPHAYEHRFLLAYACMLIYSAFALLVLF